MLDISIRPIMLKNRGHCATFRSLFASLSEPLSVFAIVMRPQRLWSNLILVAASSLCIRPFLMGDFFLRSQTEPSFLSKLMPRKERKSSRLFSERVLLLSERYPDQFPASRESQLREIRTSSFFNCAVKQLTIDQNGGSVQLFFLERKLKNELVRNSHNCDNREVGKWPRYLSARSQTHSEKSRPDFLSLWVIN